MLHWKKAGSLRSEVWLPTDSIVELVTSEPTSSSRAPSQGNTTISIYQIEQFNGQCRIGYYFHPPMSPVRRRYIQSIPLPEKITFSHISSKSCINYLFTRSGLEVINRSLLISHSPFPGPPSPSLSRKFSKDSYDPINFYKGAQEVCLFLFAVLIIYYLVVLLLLYWLLFMLETSI